MPPLPSFSTVLATDTIESLIDQFTRTDNRALAWHIYHKCRTLDHPVPEAIQQIIDRFAAGISNAAQAALDSEPGDKPVRFKAADLGRLWRDNAGKDPVGVLQAETRDTKVFSKILRETDRNNSSVAQEIDLFASKRFLGLGKKRLWDIWGAFQKDIPAPGHRTVRKRKG